MKALIVLDDKEQSNLLKLKLSELGYDTICYQWLIKALDNIEEISPHLVIISAEDYPRHWKIFVQHLKAHTFEYETKIFLLAKSLTKDELEKISILGIQDVIYDIEKDFFKLSNELTKKDQNQNDEKPEKKINTETNTDFSTQINIETQTEFSSQNTKNEIILQNHEKTSEKVNSANTYFSQIKTESKKKVVSSCTFSLLNPVTNKVILGNIRKYKYPTIIFYPNNKEEIENLRFGQIFDNCTLKQVVDNKELSSSHRCQIRGKTEEYIEFCLLR